MHSIKTKNARMILIIYNIFFPSFTLACIYFSFHLFSLIRFMGYFYSMMIDAKVITLF